MKKSNFTIARHTLFVVDISLSVIMRFLISTLQGLDLLPFSNIKLELILAI
jgi:hypothetical protein